MCYRKKLLDIELEHCLAVNYDNVRWKNADLSVHSILSIHQKKYNSISEFNNFTEILNKT
jgi:hypothetical protein